MARIDAMPQFMHPPFLGATLVAMFIVQRAKLGAPILLAIVLFKFGVTALPRVIGLATVVLLIAVLGGFLGGVAYALVDPLSRRLGVVARVLQFSLAVFVYIVPTFYGLALIPDAPESFTLSSPSDWAITGVLSVVFGCALAATFAPDRPKKKWVQRVQRVTSRVHPPAG